jgi:hypothetical protein
MTLGDSVHDLCDTLYSWNLIVLVFPALSWAAFPALAFFFLLLAALLASLPGAPRCLP